MASRQPHGFSAKSSTPVWARGSTHQGEYSEELSGLGITDPELHYKPWRMIYRILAEDVIVYCIADSRRDMQSFLERRLLR